MTEAIKPPEVALKEALLLARPFVAQWCRGERPRTPIPGKWDDPGSYDNGPEEAWLEAAERLEKIDAALSAPAALVVPAPTERAAFEAWQLSLRRPAWMLERRATTIAAGEYRDGRMEAEWEAWQARAALATQASTPPPEPETQVHPAGLAAGPSSGETNPGLA